MNNLHNNDSLWLLICNFFYYLFSSTYAMFVAVLFMFLQYLFPIKNVVLLLVAFFLLDVVFGFLAAKKLREEKFSVKIIWKHTIPRMLISIILITCAFMWDEVYKQEIISTYKLIGWFISGVLFSSISENAYLITKWAVFPNIDSIIKNKTKEGFNLKKDKDDK